MRSFLILKENVRDAALIAEYLKERHHQIICSTNNYLDALSHLCKYRPDFAIIDIGMEDNGGLELLRCIRKRSPQTYSIVCVPMQQFSIRTFIQYDVNGYLSSDHTLMELLECIDSLQEGNRYVCRKMVEKALEGEVNEAKGEMQALELSNQEKKVLHLIAKGMSPKEITQKLFITIHTLNNHKTRIRNKLNLSSNRDLMYFALQNIKNLQFYQTQA